MSTVLLVGTGEVGIRAARQLVDTPGLTGLFVVSRDTDRAATPGAMGAPATALPSPESRVDIPSGVDVVAVATDGPEARAWIHTAQYAAGVSVVTTFDAGLGEFDAGTIAANTRVISGCALTPGLSDVLARHAGRHVRQRE